MEKAIYVGSVSTVPPRSCGIATYNLHMMEPIIGAPIVRDHGYYSIVSDKRSSGLSLDYSIRVGRHVEFEIDQKDPNSFRIATDRMIRGSEERLKKEGIESGFFLQHEFGIWGADYKKDDCIVEMLQGLKEANLANMVILHTVELKPKEDKDEEAHRTRVMKGIFEYAQKIICISDSVIPGLMKKYGAPRGKMMHIAHGVPEVYIAQSREDLKREYGFFGRPVFSSVGFLSSGKGLEYVIEGFSNVLKGPYGDKKPVYFVAGETHPEVLRREGEEYRERLVSLSRQLNLRGAIITGDGILRDFDGNKLPDLRESQIVFLNHHLEDSELPRIIKMSNAGIIGNLNEEQYSSGPGSEWIGGSRITIATSSVFFKQLEKEGIGLLVPFRSASAFEDRVNHVLGLSKSDREGLEFIASDKGCTMAWPTVSDQKLRLMRKLIQHKAGARL